MEQNKPTFTGGINIALKIPKHKYDETVTFYRDTLGLTVKEEPIDGGSFVSRTHTVAFGPNTIWLDCVDNYTHVEAWFEVNTPDVAEAVDYLAEHGTTTKDEFEQLPIDKHWITDPAGTVMVVSTPEKSGEYQN